MDRKRDSVVDKFSSHLRTVCVLNLSLTNAYLSLTNTYRRPYQHLPNEYRALFRHLPTLTGYLSGTCLSLTDTYRDTYHHLPNEHRALFGHLSWKILHTVLHTPVTLLSHFAHFPAHYGHTSVTLPSHPVTPCTLFCTLLTILIYSLSAYLYAISVQKAYIYTCKSNNYYYDL